MASNKSTEWSEQKILNDSYDKTTQTIGVQNLSYDGTSNPQRDVSKNVALKVTTVGSVTYVGKAVIGSAQASAVWQCKKIDTTSGVVITWAGSGSFNQVATDLTVLSYS